MALQPNNTFKLNGVTVNEKIIPDGTKWTKTSKAGKLYKKQQKLNNNTGKPAKVTIHNTDDLKGVNDDAEQYTRATYNQNMSGVLIHFYVDDLGAWQNLKAGTGLSSNDPLNSAEVSYHSGDGSVSTGGNMTSLSIEVIMNDTADHDAKAYDNSARLAAWLLNHHKLSINDLVTHTYWVNKSAGKSFSDVDEQCCNPIKNEKWCPTYIFKSSAKATAMKNWKAYKALVKKYMDAMSGGSTTTKPAESTGSSSSSAAKTLHRVQTGAFSSEDNATSLLNNVKAAGFSDAYMVKANNLYKVQVGAFSDKANATNMVNSLKSKGFDAFITTESGTAVSTQPTSTSTTLKVGDKVKMNSAAPIYGTSSKFQSWVYSSTLYVREINGSRVVISTAKTGAVTGAVDKKYLTKV